MANGKGTDPKSKGPSADAISENIIEIQKVNATLDRLREILGDLDAMDFQRAATYLSMAIDQVELDISTKSK